MVEGRGSRVEGRGSRVEGRGSRVEGRGSRVEGRGSRVEGRGSRVEGRGSRVEGRGSRVEKFSTIIFECCQIKISYRLMFTRVSGTCLNELAEVLKAKIREVDILLEQMRSQTNNKQSESYPVVLSDPLEIRVKGKGNKTDNKAVKLKAAKD